ncbi:hypothetical protein NKJ66_07340 [Mesorhizobium sp. M0078]|uniref:hypothetical protein n=1 Tax=unclassified Mesorhizobium TaxID=325217 RepID=UPI0003CE5203|nr:hypothetical protein [Mesorhizobium sp. LNJC391B00]ESY20399.1 hypothetical protein X749_29570 [Mesorhizobium sp. LNJC391B00]
MSDFPDFDPATIPEAYDPQNPLVRANQAEFQKEFGDFQSRHIAGFRMGPAPKGEWVGMRFDMEDGTTVNVSVPITLWQAFGNEYVLAMMSAGQIIQAAYGHEGAA